MEDGGWGMILQPPLLQAGAFDNLGNHLIQSTGSQNNRFELGDRPTRSARCTRVVKEPITVADDESQGPPQIVGDG